MSENIISKWSIGKDDMFETDRGIAFKTVFLFDQMPVFKLMNAGRGGQDYQEPILNEKGLSFKDFENDFEAYLKENDFEDADRIKKVEYIAGEFYFFKQSNYSSFSEFLNKFK